MAGRRAVGSSPTSPFSWWQCCFLPAWKCCWDWGLRASLPTQCRQHQDTAGFVHSWQGEVVQGSQRWEANTATANEGVCLRSGLQLGASPCVKLWYPQLPFPDYQVCSSMLHGLSLQRAGQLSSCFGRREVLKLYLGLELWMIAKSSKRLGRSSESRECCHLTGVTALSL